MASKVIPIYEKEAEIARSLGMTLKEFRDRKALLQRQHEYLKRIQKAEHAR
jgi:hypothetical protein